MLQEDFDRPPVPSSVIRMLILGASGRKMNVIRRIYSHDYKRKTKITIHRTGNAYSQESVMDAVLTSQG